MLSGCMKIIFLILSFFAVFANASETKTFDEVIYSDEIVSSKVGAGFGLYKFLDLIEHEDIRQKYLEMRELGNSMSIQVQKLAPLKANLSKTTRYTINTFQVVMFDSKLVASLVIDSYSNRNFADASPTHYDVGEIQYFNQPD